MDIELTEEEKKFIRALKRACKLLPDTLWLFVDGNINIMRKGDNGEHVIISGYSGVDDSGGGMDQDYLVDMISDIDADGGDW